jgi:hypothetical protein
MGETATFWDFSAASYPDLERPSPTNVLVENANRSLNGNASTSSKVCTFCSIKEVLHAISFFVHVHACLFFFFFSSLY